MRQMGQQLQPAAQRRTGLQGIEQMPASDHAQAQLAQPEHDAHRNAVRLQVRVNGVGRLSAGVELFAQGLRGSIQRRCIGTALQRLSQGSQGRLQGMKGLRVAPRIRHAGADFGRIAGGTDLAHAVGQGIQQRDSGLRGQVFARVAQAQQCLESFEGVGIERLQPLGVKVARAQKLEQGLQVAGVWRGR